MDSNGTSFILLKGERDFRTAQLNCSWNPVAGAFTLTRQDQPRLPRIDPARTQKLWSNATPYVLDDHGQLGRLSSDRKTFEYSLSWPGNNWQPVRATIEGGLGDSASAVTLDPVNAPKETAFTDLHIGGSGLVAFPFSNGANDETGKHGLLLTHLRHRWQASCELKFAPVRAWVDSEDRVWVASETKIGLCRGKPLPQSYTPRDDRFEPANINPDPLRLLWQQDLPEHGGVIALAMDSEMVVILAKEKNNPETQLLLTRPLNTNPSAEFTSYQVPNTVPLASDITCLGNNQLLLLPPFEEGDNRGEERDCALLLLTASRAAQLVPERWPRLSEAGDGQGVRFVRHRDNEPRTLTEKGVTPLYRLAQARYPHQARANLTLPLDSGTPGNVWHRLYLEASIPPGCKIKVWAQAYDVPENRPYIWDLQPQPGWLPISSEIPFAPKSLTPVAEREGLFEVLLQRRNGTVRDLAGRYMRLRLTFSGDGRHTPAIYAIRAWYPRFSWQTSFLPGHFHQQASLPATTPVEPKAANVADLRERLLACFEGMMTPIEERIAAAETLLYPDATPTPFLPWLAELNATPLPRHWPEPRQRAWIEKQGELQRQRGSYGGLVKALDIITDGGVRRGEVVPIELFRLRRTLATVLGIRMDDANHPLTLGTGQSGNSIIGETLILSDENSREFLALFAPELAKGKAEKKVVEHFFDKYARRLTVVLHGPARQQRQVVADALPGLLPAVVQWNILESDHPFVLGLSPLLRIDTYLEKEPPPGQLRLSRSRLGRGHLIQNPVALAPEYALPVANNHKKGDWA